MVAAKSLSLMSSFKVTEVLFYFICFCQFRNTLFDSVGKRPWALISSVALISESFYRS